MAAKGQPFSVRFAKGTDLYVEAEAKRLQRSKSSVVEELAEEAARTRRFPGIAFRGEPPHREAWILATGLDVWELCQILDDFGSTEEVVAAYDGITPAHCRLADAFRRAYPDEIGTAIAENTRSVEDWLALYPFVEFVGAAGQTPGQE